MAIRIERIQAHYLIGLDRLARADRAGAIEHFTAVEDDGSFEFSGANPVFSARWA